MFTAKSFIRLFISFDVPSADPWFKHVEVWMSLDGDVDANYKHQINANDSFVIDPVEEGNDYWIKLRTVNTFIIVLLYFFIIIIPFQLF